MLFHPRPPAVCACLQMLCGDSPPRLANLPSQWLQYQANGSNVCRVLRQEAPRGEGVASNVVPRVLVLPSQQPLLTDATLNPEP